MNLRLPLLATLLALAATTASAGPNAQLAKSLSGSWDMNARMRGNAMLLTLRQENNFYPGIFAGANEAINNARFVLNAKENELTDELVLSSTGGFAVTVRTVPPRIGMDDRVPGQAWFADPKKNKSTITFSEFKNWTRIKNPKRDDEGASLTADFTGSLSASGKTVPLTGSAKFFIPHKITTFSFDATTTLNGADLGATGLLAAPITLRIRTNSPVSGNIPKLPNADLEFQGVD